MESTNFWADPDVSIRRNAAEGGFWLPTQAYWPWIRNRVVAALREWNGLNECNLEELKPKMETDTPF